MVVKPEPPPPPPPVDSAGHNPGGPDPIVAKRIDSVYEPGKRSRDWLKIKATLTEDFIVGGFSEGQGGRSATFGALLLGRYDDDGKLVYAGHVGSGFTDDLLTSIP